MAGLAASVVPVRAQQPNTPHIGYVYPAGGRVGTTVQVKIGGRFLDGSDGVLVSGLGVQAKVIGHDKPLPQNQLTTLRERAQELQKKLPDAAARAELQDLRLKIGDSVRRNANPVLSEFVTLEVTIAPDAEPGTRQLRLGTTLGLSNPLVFCVGQLPEFSENETKESRADAELKITLPATVNGQMIPGDVDRAQAPARQPNQYAPGDVDRFRFKAAKGQDLVIVASARDLMPYLADAVPGWFQATLTLFDTTGHEVAYDDDFRFQPDPVIHFLVPADGEYVVEIKDALFRGREDFVYRISIGELPFVTSIFPLGGRAHAKTSVGVKGWNLPTAAVTMDVSDAGVGTYPLVVRRGMAVSNRVPFAVDTLAEVVEKESNDTQKDAQRLTLPVIVNGRIQRPGDWDVFSFSGRSGETIVAEVVARRLGSPLDSVLELTDAAGRRVAINDDVEDAGAGLLTHQADSRLTATLPAAGPYFLRVGDTQHKGGPEFGYRLRVGAPRPDFELRVTPSALNASAGTSVPVVVHAVRKDGFAGDIVLSLKDAPAGFTLSGGMVPAGQDRVRLTLTVPPGAAREPLAVVVEGRAVVGGNTVVHRAEPAEDMMQAFAYRHLVPTDELRVVVLARGAVRVPASILSAQPVKVPAGQAARVRVAIPPGYRTFENVEFELSEPPDGITLRDVSVGPGVADFAVQVDVEKIKAGLKGNLIVSVSGERRPGANAAPDAARRRVPMGMLPAIRFEVVEAPR
jgi:hypothetical protein